MEKIFIDAIRPIFVDSPVLSITVFAVITFLRWKMKEYDGWISRVERDTKSGFESIREGLKEERQFRNEIVVRHDELIRELGREVSEIKGKIGKKK